MLRPRRSGARGFWRPLPRVDVELSCDLPGAFYFRPFCFYPISVRSLSGIFFDLLSSGRWLGLVSGCYPRAWVIWRCAHCSAADVLSLRTERYPSVPAFMGWSTDFWRVVAALATACSLSSSATELAREGVRTLVGAFTS